MFPGRTVGGPPGEKFDGRPTYNYM